MIVTTCGAAGGAGFFGGGAGVCASVKEDSAAINNVTRCKALKFILVLLTTQKSLLQDLQDFQDYQPRFGAN